MSSQADILAECIDAIFAGADPSAVLLKYPKDASDIAPLIETARRLWSTRSDFEALGEAEVVRRLLQMPAFSDSAIEPDKTSMLRGSFECGM